MMRRRRGPSLLATAVVVGGAAHVGAKSAQKGAQEQANAQAAAQQDAEQSAQIAELQAQQAAAAAAPAAPRRALPRPRSTRRQPSCRTWPTSTRRAS